LRSIAVRYWPENWPWDASDVGALMGVGHEIAHVGMARDSGPMPGKDPSAVGVDFALPQNSHTGSLKSQIESADA
jgi:hypothetical protein